MSDQRTDFTASSDVPARGLRVRAIRQVRSVLSCRPSSWKRSYWATFLGIMVVGVAYRAFWTFILRAPFINPDTSSYLAPFIQHPWAPFSEIRTAGAPFVFMIGASSVFHPVGILLIHHALWLSSSAALAISIKRHLGLRLLSLLVLAYLTFNAKALSFEYYAISEHTSRVLYVFYAVAAVATWSHPRSLRLATVTAALIAFNILVKPSAIVLLPATIILYAFHSWRLGAGQRRSALAAGIFSIALSLGCLAGYATFFKERYGVFALSNFEGFNLFSHVGHLVNLEGGAYSELKRELAPIMVIYQERYVATGTHAPNWLVYGSANDQLKADFGNISPASIIRDYAVRATGRGDIVSMNKIYLDLAIEGIIAHPRAYLNHAWISFNSLLRGYSFIYYQILPSPATIEAHRDSMHQLRVDLFRLAGTQVPDGCVRAREIAQSSTWPLRTLMSDASIGCVSPIYDIPHVRGMIVKVHALYSMIAGNIHSLLTTLPFWAMVLAPLLLWPRWHGVRARKIAFFALFFAICALGYCTLLALFNVAEVSRFMVNIQDYLVLAMSFVLAGVAVSVRRALLRLTYLPAFRNIQRSEVHNLRGI
jgi:hypothetical protein